MMNVVFFTSMFVYLVSSSPAFVQDRVMRVTEGYEYNMFPDAEGTQDAYVAYAPYWAICYLRKNKSVEFAVYQLPNGTIREWPSRDRNRTSDVIQTPKQVSSVMKIHPFYPGCFPGDDKPRVMNITLVLDQSMKDASRRQLDQLASVARVAFLQQIRVTIRIQDIERIEEDMPTNAVGAFLKFEKWAFSKWRSTAYRMLISNTYTGITGVAYVGSICSSFNAGVSNNDWLDFAHEIGHAIGAGHTFGKGGIMDYADGTYDGDVQMHPDLRSTVCPFLAYTLPRCVGHVGVATTGCGDGILSSGEECECVEYGKTSCGSCVNCKLALRDVECSTEFLLPNQNPAHSACCVNERVTGVKTECEKGKACGARGECVSSCYKAFGKATKTCGFDRMGCKQGCVFNGKCRWDIRVGSDLVSELQNGTTCLGGGTCVGGRCVGFRSCSSYKNRKQCASSLYCKWRRKRCVTFIR
jgi:hypothetical protein